LLLYLDSSAVVKIYVNEEYRNEVFALLSAILSGGGRLTISDIGYVEVRAALAAICRVGRVNVPGYRELVRSLETDMKSLHLVLNAEHGVFARAAQIPSPTRYQTPGSREKHPLRGYDAVHLALALEARDRYTAGGEEVLMLTFDRELHAAAVAEGVAHECPDSACPGGLRFSGLAY